MFSLQSTKYFLTLVAMVAVFAIACGTEEDSTGAAPTVGTGDTPTEVPQSQSGTEIVDAPIVKAEMQILEIFPPRYMVAITSGLPNSCHTFNDIEIQRESTAVDVHVTNTMLVSIDNEPIACAEIFGMVDHTVELPGDYLMGQTYTVDVNDTVLTFEGQDLEGLPTAIPSDETVLDIIGQLDAAFVDMQLGQALENTVFGLDARVVLIDGEAVQLYEFSTAEEAKAASDRVAPDGSIAGLDGTVSMMNWVDTPNFFLRGNVISLYVGQDARILDTLGQVAGEQFALPGSDIEPIPTEQPGDVVLEPAPIESAEVVVLESFPPQYVLNVTIGIPSGCHEFDSYNVKRGEQTVAVQILNKRPAGLVPCTTIYGYQDLNIPLEGPFDMGVEFNVLINEELVTTFTGQDISEVPPTEQPGDVVVEAAPVEAADVAILESFPPQYVLNVTIGLPSGCHTFNSFDVKRDGRAVDVQVLNEVPADAMVCTAIYGYHELRIPLEGPFESGTEFDVIINGERQGTFIGQG